MGKATILEHLGNAKYRVLIDRHSDRVAAVIRQLRAEADRVEDTLPELRAAADAAHAKMVSAKIAYEADQQRINDEYAAHTTKNMAPPISNLLGAYTEAFAQYEAAQEKYLGMKQHVQHLRADANKKEEQISPREAEIWCSTYTTDLAAGQEVATIEVARKTDDFPHSVIAPGGAAYTEEQGQIRTIASMTPAQAFMNYVMLAGATKWRRRYSAGVVVDVTDKDELVVLPYSNFFGDIEIQADNQSPHIIPHAACGDRYVFGAYKKGDKVLICHNDGKERVIGFACEPRKCVGMRNTIVKNICVELVEWVGFGPDYKGPIAWYSVKQLQVFPRADVHDPNYCSRHMRVLVNGEAQPANRRINSYLGTRIVEQTQNKCALHLDNRDYHIFPSTYSTARRASSISDRWVYIDHHGNEVSACNLRAHVSASHGGGISFYLHGEFTPGFDGVIIYAQGPEPKKELREEWPDYENVHRRTRGIVRRADGTIVFDSDEPYARIGGYEAEGLDVNYNMDPKKPNTFSMYNLTKFLAPGETAMFYGYGSISATAVYEHWVSSLVRYVRTREVPVSCSGYISFPVTRLHGTQMYPGGRPYRYWS